MKPGETLLNHVRGGFVAQGTNLHKWSREHGLHPQCARMYLLGDRNGPVARKWRARLITAAGVGDMVEGSR